MYEIEVKGLQELINKLNASVKDEVIKRSLSQSSQNLAAWAAEKRFYHGGHIRGAKIVQPNILTSRSGRYRGSIVGQTPSQVQKSGSEYTARYGTNVTNRGFSYPRLHEYGGIFHRKRPVLTPAIENTQNRQAVLDNLAKNISEALKK